MVTADKLALVGPLKTVHSSQFLTSVAIMLFGSIVVVMVALSNTAAAAKPRQKQTPQKAPSLKAEPVPHDQLMCEEMVLGEATFWIKLCCEGLGRRDLNDLDDLERCAFCMSPFSLMNSSAPIRRKLRALTNESEQTMNIICPASTNYRTS